MLEVLVRDGKADPDVCDNFQKNSALTLVVQKANVHPKLITKLVELGANVQTPQLSHIFGSLLHLYTIKHKNAICFQVIDSILQAGLDLNVQCK